MELGASIPANSYVDYLYLPVGFNTYTIVIVDTVDQQGKVNGLKPTEEDLIKEINTVAERMGEDVKIEIRLHSGCMAYNGNVFQDFYPNLHDKFLNYPAVETFFIVDEPSFAQLDCVEQYYVPWFNEYYANTRMQFLVNMLSGYSTAMGGLRDINGNLITNNGKYYCANGLWDGVEGYAVENGRVTNKKVTMVLTDQEKKDMLTAYHNKWLGILSEVQADYKVFSHDAYPFFDNQGGKIILTDIVDENGKIVCTAQELKAYYLQYGGFTEEHFLMGTPEEGYEPILLQSWLSRSLNMAILARDNGYVFGVHIQVFDSGGTGCETYTWRLPTTTEEVTWQIYMSIAMGAKSINYFGFGSTKNGQYMTAGTNPTPAYYPTKEANLELLKVQHVFSAFDTWVGLKTFGATGKALSEGLQLVEDRGQNLQSLTNVTSVVTSGELVVGEMIDGNGNHGYMLVGYDDPLNGNSTEVQMTFDGAAGFIVYRGGERTLVEAVNGVFSTTISAGEGVFVIPVYMD